MKDDVELKFLEELLDWCKEEDRILEEIASLEKQLRPSHIIH